MPRTYTVQVSSEFVERYRDWTRISDLPAAQFRVVPREDGTAEIWLTSGDGDAPEDRRIIYAS